jgi:lycopene cyclase domain-containing protein
MMFFYLAGLLMSIGGLALLDRRFALAFWHNAKQTSLTLGCAVAIFLVWDILGIALGIFLHGESMYSLPFTIAPEFPLEEIVFLFLLCYSALIIYRGVGVWRSRTLS